MKKFSLAGVLLGMILLAISAWPGIGPQYTVFAGTTLVLPDDTTGVTVVNPPKGFSGTLMMGKSDGHPAIDVTPLPPVQTFYNLTLAPAGNTIQLQVLSHRYGYLAALGALLLLLGAPGVLIPDSPLTTDNGRPVTGWLYLLVDKNGLNLPRVLLIIFFIPCAIVYFTLAFPLHQFPALPDSIWQLLGFGGAGAALGAILDPSTKAPNGAAPVAASAVRPANPTMTLVPDAVNQANYQVAAAGESVPPALITIKRPDWTDLFRDPAGYGDISNFQTFVISTCTAVVFLFSFFDNWVIPAIPDRVLELLGTSLAVYLGVKGIKVVKQG